MPDINDPHEDPEEEQLGYDPILKRSIVTRKVPLSISSDLEARAQYVKAITASVGLKHPNLRTIYDCAQNDEDMHLILESVPMTILDALSHGHDLRALIAGLVSGLDYAHQHGVIHQSVAPRYIRVTEGGVVKIWGFGVGLLEAQHARISWADEYHYMSPEQTRGDPVDRRTDIFSLGVLLYLLLAGRLPFPGKSLPTLADQVLRLEPEPLDDEADSRLVKAVHRCLAKDPADRFQSLGEFMDAL